MIGKIIWRNVWQKPLGTTLSMILLMFGTGIIALILVLDQRVEEKFNNDLEDIDLVVGAKGSPLQLVLSAVYQVDAPTGNISREEADRIAHYPLVAQAIPLAYGDSYQSYRIVGTEAAYLEKYHAQFAKGRVFDTVMEAVVGSAVARATGLQVGATFLGTHGLGQSGHVHKEFVYMVTGMLKPTGTVLDQLVLTNIATVWQIHAHPDNDGDDDAQVAGMPHAANGVAALNGVQPANAALALVPNAQITALLIKLRSPMALLSLPRIINETTNMQAASPALEMNRLFSLLGVGVKTLQVVAFSIMLLAGLSVFIALYQRLQERRYELALSRVMGCSRMRLFTMVLAEGGLLSIAGYLAGLALCHAGLYWLQQTSGHSMYLSLQPGVVTGAEIYLCGFTLGVGLLAALLPAVKAFSLNISKTLAND